MRNVFAAAVLAAGISAITAPVAANAAPFTDVSVTGNLMSSSPFNILEGSQALSPSATWNITFSSFSIILVEISDTGIIRLLPGSFCNSGCSYNINAFYDFDFGAGAPELASLTVIQPSPDLDATLSVLDSDTVRLTVGSGSWSAQPTYLVAQLDASVPEPASAALVGLGLLGLAAARRRRN